MRRGFRLLALMALLGLCVAQDPVRFSVDIATDGSVAAERIVAAVARLWPEAVLLREGAITNSSRPAATQRRQLLLGATTQPRRAVAFPTVQVKLLQPLRALKERIQTLWPGRGILEIALGENAKTLGQRIAAWTGPGVVLIEEGALAATELGAVLSAARAKGLVVAGTMPELSALGAALVLRADADRCAAALVAVLRMGVSPSAMPGASLELEDHTTFCTGVLSELHRSGAQLTAATLGSFDELLVGAAQ